MALLISTIGAGLITDEIKEDLITSADPYTIDGENIPVLIGEDGKTHFPSDFVEAIRQKMIDLGVFVTESGYDIDTSGHTYNPVISDYLEMPLKPMEIGDTFVYRSGPRTYTFILTAKNNCEVFHVVNTAGTYHSIIGIGKGSGTHSYEYTENGNANTKT